MRLRTPSAICTPRASASDMMVFDVAGELKVAGRQALLSACLPQSEDGFAVVDPLVECGLVFVGLLFVPGAD